MKKGRKRILKLGLPLLIMIFATSCVPVNKLSYFNDIDQIGEPVINPKIQKTISPFDRLYIRVLSTDPQTSQIFNATDEIRNSTAGTSLVGYQVDESGNINFPFVGKINIGSLTTADASLKIQNALKEYVSNNVAVTVKYLDNQVSVLGEVERQGVYTFAQDKINIYEALSLGGGLTRYGNRKNIIVIRQEGDKLMHNKLNLSDSKIASKDFYYILPNDVIVVEPLGSVSTSYVNNTYSTILSSITTLIAILLFTGVKL
jgi:polysaccharide biosynthesis/export protein